GDREAARGRAEQHQEGGGRGEVEADDRAPAEVHPDRTRQAGRQGARARLTDAPDRAASALVHRSMNGGQAMRPPSPDPRPLRRALALAGATMLLASLAAVVPAGVLAINGGACNAPYPLTVNPPDFTDAGGNPNAIDNAFFPLVQGTTFTYDGVKDG